MLVISNPMSLPVTEYIMKTVTNCKRNLGMLINLDPCVSRPGVSE